MFCRLHKSPLDMLMYYDGQVNGQYQGLFNPLTSSVFPAYFSFQSFNELYVLKNEVYTKTDSEFPIIAASDGLIGKILIPNITNEYVDININLPSGWKVTANRILDGTNGLINLEIPKKMTVPPYKIVMIECKRTNRQGEFA